MPYGLKDFPVDARPAAAGSAAAGSPVSEVASKPLPADVNGAALPFGYRLSPAQRAELREQVRRAAMSPKTLDKPQSTTNP